jgi:MtN3 and saliva related transmembrane protein
VSLVTQIAFACGIALWLVYGQLIGSWPVILSNCVTLVLVLAILVLKLRFG